MPEVSAPDPSPDDGYYDAHVEAVVDAMPPLRPEQIAKLAALFDYRPVKCPVCAPRCNWLAAH
ncbi:MAG: hypothetical protein ACXV7I_15915 [Ilumatobacteraceae bacterium]